MCRGARCACRASQLFTLSLARQWLPIIFLCLHLCGSPTGICAQKHPTGKEGPSEERPSECQVRWWRAVSAAGSRGQGSRKKGTVPLRRHQHRPRILLPGGIPGESRLHRREEVDPPPRRPSAILQPSDTSVSPPLQPPSSQHSLVCSPLGSKGHSKARQAPTHTPAKTKDYVQFMLYTFALMTCFTYWFGHGRGYEISHPLRGQLHLEQLARSAKTPSASDAAAASQPGLVLR